MSKGRHVYVTGGSGLIGKAIVTCFKEKKYKVTNIDRSEDADFVVDLNIEYFKTEEFERFFEKIKKDDIWINSLYPPLWTEHLVAYNILSEYAAEAMVSKGGGCIINMSSIYGIRGTYPHLYTDGAEIKEPSIEYCMVKGGINAMTKALATRYGEYGVRANTIIAGGVNDDHQERDMDFYEQYICRVPLFRMAEPEEIAHAALFFAENSYVTGQELAIDGGYTAW